MMHSLQEEMVKLIPSRDLQKAIRDSGYSCSEMALLALAFQCSPDFDSRLRHLQLLRDSFSGRMRTYADSLMATQRQMLETFLETDDGIVFELHIKETPDAWDECYLCASYGAAVRMIALFYQEYGGQENPSTRYRIVKRRILSGESFAEDNIGTALLLPGAILHSVDLAEHFAEEHPELCTECADEDEAYRQAHCPDCCNGSAEFHAATFPCFLSDLDTVEYSMGFGPTAYGIVRHQGTAPAADYFVIPLDTAEMCRHRFDIAHWPHHHIPAPFVWCISPESLPPSMQEDRLAYLSFLREHPDGFIPG